MLNPSTNIRDFIDRLMKEGWSERRLAKAIGVTQPTIYMWRFKKTPDSFIALRKLAKIAEVSIEELLGGPEERTARPEPEVKRLINRFTTIVGGVRRPGERFKILHKSSTFLRLIDSFLITLDGTLEAVRTARERGQNIRLVPKFKISKTNK